jgi:hypothetical protein
MPVPRSRVVSPPVAPSDGGLAVVLTHLERMEERIAGLEQTVQAAHQAPVVFSAPQARVPEPRPTFEVRHEPVPPEREGVLRRIMYFTADQPPAHPRAGAPSREPQLLSPNQEETIMSQQGNRPVKEFRAGGIRASIWSSRVDRNGKAHTRFSVRIEKRSRDENGTWQTSSTLFPNDLPRVQLVAAKAFEFIGLKETKVE